MNKHLQHTLVEKARRTITTTDPSHDFSHAFRVMGLAEEISSVEGGDIEIVIPAALFHDVITYQKNDPRSKQEAEESAVYTAEYLLTLAEYPHEKVEKVYLSIRDHSFSKGIFPDFLEAQILQDADRLEATGAIAIMRTFASTGQMQRPFYHPDDPFAETRSPDAHAYGLDLFPERLLRVAHMMHTDHAKKLAKERTDFLHAFLKQLRSELHLDDSSE